MVEIDLKNRILGTHGTSTRTPNGPRMSRADWKNRYWSKTKRADNVFFDFFGNESTEEELDKAYNSDEEFQEMVDSDFEEWYQEKRKR